MPISVREFAILSYGLFGTAVLLGNEGCNYILDIRFSKAQSISKFSDFLPLGLFIFFVCLTVWREKAGDFATMLLLFGLVTLEWSRTYEYLRRRKPLDNSDIPTLVSTILQTWCLVIFFWKYGTNIVPVYRAVIEYGETAISRWDLECSSQFIVKLEIIPVLLLDLGIYYKAFAFCFSESNRPYVLVIVKSLKIVCLWTISELWVPKFTDKQIELCVLRSYLSAVASPGPFIRMVLALSTISTLLLWPQNNKSFDEDKEDLIRNGNDSEQQLSDNV